MWSGAGGGGRCQPCHGHRWRSGFLEAGPGRNDFPKANASKMPALDPGTVPVQSQQKARAHQNAGMCRMLQTPCTLGFFLCSPGLQAAHSLPREPSDRQTDGCLPAPVPWRSQAQWDRMRQGYFSPSTQAPILQMTHFLHLLPITLQLVQTAL